MNKTTYRRLFAMVLVCSFVFSFCPTAYAADDGYPVEENEDSVYFGDGFIREQQSLQVNNSAIHVVRTSYKNGTSVISVTENGLTTQINSEINYEILLQNLRSKDAVSTYAQPSGYTYTYMKTEQVTEYASPKDSSYATILGSVSIALSFVNAPLSIITGIAGIIIGFSASSVEAKLSTTSVWYFKTETVSGEFICYYVECTTDTYAKDTSGSWVYLGSESWDYETLSI